MYKAIKLNRKANYSWLQDNLGVSEATIKRAISDLKELGYINKGALEDKSWVAIAEVNKLNPCPDFITFLSHHIAENGNEGVCQEDDREIYRQVQLEDSLIR